MCERNGGAHCRQGCVPLFQKHLLQGNFMAHQNHLLFDNLIWMDSKEAAHYLRVSVYALRMMVWRGKLNAYRLGRRLRFKRADLDRLLKLSPMGGSYVD